MSNYDSKKIALNWRWVKILLPLWVIFGGLPLILMDNPNSTTTIIVLAVSFVVALAVTAFCIKCFLFYLDEYERQKKKNDKLQSEMQETEDDNGTRQE